MELNPGVLGAVHLSRREHRLVPDCLSEVVSVHFHLKSSMVDRTENVIRSCINPNAQSEPSMLCILGGERHFCVDASCEVQNEPKDRTEILQKRVMFYRFGLKVLQTVLN